MDPKGHLNTDRDGSRATVFSQKYLPVEGKQHVTEVDTPVCLYCRHQSDLGRGESFRVFMSPMRKHFDNATNAPPLKTMQSRKTQRVTDAKFRVTGFIDIKMK